MENGLERLADQLDGLCNDHLDHLRALVSRIEEIHDQARQMVRRSYGGGTVAPEDEAALEAARNRWRQWLERRRVAWGKLFERFHSDWDAQSVSDQLWGWGDWEDMEQKDEVARDAAEEVETVVEVVKAALDAAQARHHQG